MEQRHGDLRLRGGQPVAADAEYPAGGVGEHIHIAVGAGLYRGDCAESLSEGLIRFRESSSGAVQAEASNGSLEEVADEAVILIARANAGSSEKVNGCWSHMREHPLRIGVNAHSTEFYDVERIIV